MTAVAFGVVAAMLYGASDIVARFAGQSFGVLRTMLFSQAVTLLVFGAAFGLGAFSLPSGATPAWVWLVAIADNLGVLVATALFYRAIVVGPISVVVPIASSYGAVTALLSALLGESLSIGCLAGILITVIGCAIVSIPPPAQGSECDRRAGGLHSIVMAVVSALIFGVAVGIQGRYVVPALGAALPLWLYYLVGAPILIVAVIASKQALVVPPLTQWPVVLGAGALNTLAALLLAIAAAVGAVAVPTALTALSSIVTALVARKLFDERLAAHQWAGILIGVLGTGVIHATAT